MEMKIQREDRQHGEEWERTARFVIPKEEIEEEGNSKDCSREEKGGEESIARHSLASKVLVDAGGGISSEDSHPDIEEKHCGQNSALICGREEPEHGKD